MLLTQLEPLMLLLFYTHTGNEYFLKLFTTIHETHHPQMSSGPLICRRLERLEGIT